MKICSVEGCENPVRCKMLCSKHYCLFLKHGFVPDRIKTDPNEIIIRKDHAEILLYNNYGETVGAALIDIEDIDKVSDKKWFMMKGHNTFYCVCANSGKQLRLHRVILNLNSGREVQVDHKNHDGLDCRKKNLRLATNEQNSYNARKAKGKYSKYKGVSWHKGCQRWIAQIRFMGKNKHIGVYTSEKKAAKAYNAEALVKFGEFAVLNKLG